VHDAERTHYISSELDCRCVVFNAAVNNSPNIDRLQALNKQSL
jgi:hypothetical protein